MAGDHAAPDRVPRRVRQWLYGIVTAAAPLLVVYGIVDEQTAPLWVALAGQVLATGTAAVYTPTSDTA